MSDLKQFMEFTCSQVACLPTYRCPAEPLPTALEAACTHLACVCSELHAVHHMGSDHSSLQPSLLSSRLLYPVNTSHDCISLPSWHILNFDPRLPNIFQIAKINTSRKKIVGWWEVGACMLIATAFIRGGESRIEASKD